MDAKSDTFYNVSLFWRHFGTIMGTRMTTCLKSHHLRRGFWGVRKWHDNVPLFDSILTPFWSQKWRPVDSLALKGRVTLIWPRPRRTRTGVTGELCQGGKWVNLNSNFKLPCHSWLGQEVGCQTLAVPVSLVRVTGNVPVGAPVHGYRKGPKTTPF